MCNQTGCKCRIGFEMKMNITRQNIVLGEALRLRASTQRVENAIHMVQLSRFGNLCVMEAMPTRDTTGFSKKALAFKNYFRVAKIYRPTGHFANKWQYSCHFSRASVV